MSDSTDVKKSPGVSQRLRQMLVPAVILVMAAGILFLIAGNWNTWASERPSQQTDDASLRADLTPLSTKVPGLVASVAVSDYQAVKAGDLLVQLRDDDFRAQVQQAEAAVSSGDSALINNRRQTGCAKYSAHGLFAMCILMDNRQSSDNSFLIHKLDVVHFVPGDDEVPGFRPQLQQPK